MSNFFNGNSDEPSRYMTDNTALGAAMMRAREAEEAANRAKADALAVEAAERAKAAEIARAVELSVANNPQLLAQRMGVRTSGVVSSQNAGVVAPMNIVEQTNVRVLGGIEVSFRQAKDMADVGQITQSEFNKAVADALAARGLVAPKSFR